MGGGLPSDGGIVEGVERAGVRLCFEAVACNREIRLTSVRVPAAETLSEVRLIS